ncbi:MAG: hypothetical protein ALECFALPRED_006914 [Alectoria fallacina]|uniref:Zn(2)-C6 fungal-type domain-containing protein n=1 Tax=Alectoria fallacina TaxID=1903189 RepID=A0A8H3GBF8_9LECA|nr:MAG: hypothetical protein ALECFALPRED_006914 [Alectoria fallacina]
MNPLPAALPRSQSSAGSVGNAAAISTTASPTSVKGKRSRKRESSSASELDGYEGSVGDKKRQPGVKRACNECRQQKLRCDVVTEPLYTICTRCRRLNLECKIESNFRRVGKRSKNAEMEREIVELRRQLGLQQAPPPTTGPTIKASSSTSASPTISHLPAHMDQYMGSEEAVASLMDLRSGLEGGSFLRSPNAQLLHTRRIGDIVLTHDRVQELFQHFFTFYHPFIPFLDPTRTTDEYYQSSPLLFWTIISVATRRYDPSLLTSLAVPLSELLWKTIAEVPQNYIVVKALCILCTWPLPISSTSSDPTFMLSGLMMQVAMQIGLHRPSHAQDFTKFKVKLREEELRDRVRTWATCNAVAQRVATGYGQPPSTFYDWTLASSGAHEPSFRLSDDVYGRLLIEKFSNKVTKALYSNRLDPVGLVSDNERSVHTTFLAREYEDLEQKLQLDGSFSTVYLRAANLHLHLSAFFDSPSSSDYRIDLFALWRSTTSFLEAALHIESAAGNVLVFSTNYILQMIIAAGFSLLKLMNSFFASHVDIEYGRNLFNRTIQAIRSISVFTNDLPNRLAEVLAQLWRSSGAGSRRMVAANDGTDSSLRLKVKCRMSMSLVFDSVWRWREEFQAQGRGNLESALKNPTNPDPAVESSATSLADNSSLAPSALLAGTLTPSDGFGGESHYEVFDPLNWMLDGLVDLPYDLSMAPDMEVQGLT